MKIAVTGAGAVGAYVGGRLAEAGHDVTLIARGAYLAALQRDGLTINSPLGTVTGHAIRTTDNPGEIGLVDIVIFGVKMWDTEAAASGLAVFKDQPPTFKSSMLEALENGKRLELPWLSSRVCKLAEKHRISVPANRAAHWGLILHEDGSLS